MSDRRENDGVLADDERFMRAALEEAQLAAAEGEVPVGAVVVRDGSVIARAHNRREADADPSAHAEFSAIIQASQALGRWRLPDCTVYVTLEPCAMCAGLMVNARIGRCVYGAADERAGALGSLYQLGGDERLNHAFAVRPGVLADECSALLRDFFADRRDDGGTDGLRARDELPPQVEAAEGDFTAALASVPAPRVLIAADSFKGSATSLEVADGVAAGVRHVAPGAQVICLPVADGGEGTLDAIAAVREGELVTREVTGPARQRVKASYLAFTDADGAPAALVEMARAAGITLTDRSWGAALAATTYGVGELVRDALVRGARRIYLGLGGSATNDGGAGFLQALGARITDAAGADVAPGLSGVRTCAAIDLAPAFDALAGAELIALTDVSNPLVGPRGALPVFGPQKGLDPASPEFPKLEQDMVAYGALLDAACRKVVDPAFRSLPGVPGAGAAGGLGAAVLALGGSLKSGIDAVLDIVGFDEAAAAADLVITGEGMIDEQTASGKVPVGVARRAKRQNPRARVVALGGGRADDVDAVYEAGVDLVLSICRRPMPLERAMTAGETRANLVVAGETAVRAYLM